MTEQEPSPWSVSRGDELHVKTPAIEDVTVLLDEPRERTTLPDGRSHLVFVRASGNMVGVNLDLEADVDRCVLVEDEDGFQHVLVRSSDSEEVVFTRRQPGQPDDWERRDGFEITAV